MPTRSTLPRSRLVIERFALDNGLRVVLSPDRSAPVVGIAVTYDVGFRSEPEGRTGFAHLFEHLMFQGSSSLEKGEAPKLIQGNGGVLNGSTHPDFTVYISELPSNALDLALYLEADRMRGVRLTDANLRNQIDVVKEEIRLNVLNRPFGGFPWIDLPPILFRTFNNTHNGYGSFVDLESATVADAADFFRRFYCPANAVLCVAGDFDVREARGLVESHFGDIASRRRPRLPDCAEPVPDRRRDGTVHDPAAPMPAVAIGYRIADPVKAVPEYLAAAVLAQLLGGTDASRLHQRLVKGDQAMVAVTCRIGHFGEPFAVRDPTMLQVLGYLNPSVGLEAVIDAVDAEIAEVAAGVDEDEVRRAVVGLVSQHLAQLDGMQQRAITMAVAEQQRGAAEFVNDLPELLAQVDAAGVASAAQRWLRPDSRAVLSVVPGSGDGPRKATRKGRSR